MTEDASTLVGSLVPTISGTLKRKLSLGSSGDEEYEVSGDLGSLDDESSIQCDEDEKDEDEINDLKKEGDLPIEQLMNMYGLDNSNNNYVEFKEESRESGSDTESTDVGRRMTMYDKDDWKKEILVGPEYQAVIPALLDKEILSTDKDADTLLWRPDKLKSEELNKYLSKVYFKDELPVTGSTRDDEEALFILHAHEYQVGRALEKSETLHASSNGCSPRMKPWSEEECQGFENGLKLYGKQFHLIQKKFVPCRSISEVVQFYYLWKKTERYDIFIQYYQLGSARYIFNPGQPLDLDRSSYICNISEEQDNLHNMQDSWHDVQDSSNNAHDSSNSMQDMVDVAQKSAIVSKEDIHSTQEYQLEGSSGPIMASSGTI